jgi:hypothetical protein
VTRDDSRRVGFDAISEHSGENVGKATIQEPESNHDRKTGVEKVITPPRRRTVATPFYNSIGKQTEYYCKDNVVRKPSKYAVHEVAITVFTNSTQQGYPEYYKVDHKMNDEQHQKPKQASGIQGHTHQTYNNTCEQI